ncbi:heterokaryon incompatibility protein-domain-containing protein [Schizothecium vesticola]|uniref:Heterokaryon incompatibility protein-domain-containing protein n=1 Tax=Schizothecium vesticola TaxID=314040 RepID=A0AA40KB81_9PEZI|nr:heterokaryon incompatibility protein-domain-containing protein [Schizothecium vesticola]
MSDDDRALINVWMQSEEEGRQDAETNSEDYDTAFNTACQIFNQYKHHHFDGEWKVYSEDKYDNRRDEEWFISSPTILGDSDPEYLCDMCRHMDFAALLTRRGLPGNNEPGSSVIQLPVLPGLFGPTGCSFCTLVRRGLQDRCTPDEIDAAKEAKGGKMRLTVLDDGPDYALRLEVGLESVAPRVVVQMLAPEQAPLPLQGLLVRQDMADMGRLRTWIRTCEERHHDQAVTSPVASIPSGPSTLRVIDVEEGRVVTATTPCRYACLSYVWGNEAGAQLTTETRSVLESVGGLTDVSIRLGQTLQDAVKVAKAIGLRYLWIDALCILQDDDEDKTDIISRMGAIYGNAVITIVASTNSTPTEGLPGVAKVPRTRAQVVQKMQGIALAAAFHDARLPYQDIEDSVWNSRAWTFQERQLSRRAVYFTSSQMYFTCPHEVVSEDTVPGLLTDQRPTQLMDRSRFQTRLWALMDYIWNDPTQTRFPNKTFHIHGLGSQAVSMMSSDESVPAPIYRATPVPTRGGGGALRVEGETVWKAYSDAVSMYTRRKMSWQTDALRAFHGVGDLVAQGVHTAFWHGLPEFNLDAALLWYPRELLTRRTHADASPSWSWAGWEGHAAYRGRGWRNAPAHPPASVVRWYQFKHPRDLIHDFLVDGEPHTPAEIADFAFRTARRPAEVCSLDPAVVFRLADIGGDGWIHARDTDRNEHYYTHPAYPGLRFTYPATLPSQMLVTRAAPDGALFFVARTVPARLVDMATTPHNPVPGVDDFLQIGVGDDGGSSHRRRRPWEHIIYHQGYRAGFLARHAALDATARYALVAMSRDTVPGIAPPMGGWDAYWGLTPRRAQHMAFYEWEWGDEGERMPVLGPNRHDDGDEPYRGGGYENGDPRWDTARFGSPYMLDVYNVLLLERKKDEDDGREWWERVGVGKMNSYAFWHAKPDEGMIVLR